MGYNRTVAGLVGHRDCCQCLSQGTDLVELDQDRIGDAGGDAFPFRMRFLKQLTRMGMSTTTTTTQGDRMDLVTIKSIKTMVVVGAS